MKVEKIILDEDHKVMVLHYENGDREVKEYPPKNAEDKKLVAEMGGHYELSRATWRYNQEASVLEERWERFKEREITIRDSFVIDSIIAADLTKADVMKIKMSIFKKDEVRDCTNNELLTNLRKSEDIIDLLMYYGMVKNGINNWS